MKEYYEHLQIKADEAYEIAAGARSLGKDPIMKIEAPQAKDLADRVEGISGPVGVSARLRELIEQMDREASTKLIMQEIIDGKFGKLNTEQEKIEQAVRTGLTILTEAIVVAGTEGIDRITINENPDKSKYLTMYFAGPIRSAGGGGQAQAVILCDYARTLMNIGPYKPTNDEIERCVEEMGIYHNAVSRLQYFPPDDDTRYILKHCPICISGDQTTDVEVAVNKNIPRVETNRIRGGMCLVVGEGIAQKAAKEVKFAKKFGLDWSWLGKLVKTVKKDDADEKTEVEIKPLPKYLDDIVGGRPIFAYPMRKGAFRLRYGRARNTGIAAKAIHPATMILLDEFPAVGTQLRVERPGKGTVCCPCDSIEGPIVKLKNGTVVRVESAAKAEDIKHDIGEILFLGDMLISYGDFSKANHPLVPPGFCEEWWSLILENKDIKVGDAYKITSEQALELSEKHKVPLHPKYTYYYNDITREELIKIIMSLSEATIVENKTLGGETAHIIEMPLTKDKRILEMLGILHRVEEDRVIIQDALPLIRTLGLPNKDIGESFGEGQSVLQIINSIAPFPIYDKSGTYIGARMGRPEKAKERAMARSPNGLFPIGESGGRMTLVDKAREANKIEIQKIRLVCPQCKQEKLNYTCEKCGQRNVIMRSCVKCGKNTMNEKCDRCNNYTSPYHSTTVDFRQFMNDTEAQLKERAPDKFKAIVGTINKDKYFEPMEKGLLRAKHGVYPYRDGTIRFDSTDMPLTYFKPKEIGVSLSMLKDLGYEKDYQGNEITSNTQICELKPQDLLLSEFGVDYMLSVTRFLDDLLEKFYGLPRYYNATKREDLLGHLVVGLAPHISAATMARIIGFTKARVGYAHPYFHCAKRRNCFSGDTKTFLWDDNKKKTIREPIGDIVDDLEKKYPNNKKPIDGFGTIKIDNPYNWYAYSIDKNSGKFVKKKVKTFVKGKHQNWVALKTSTGKEMCVTADHDILTNSGTNRFSHKKAEDVKVGEKIPYATRFPGTNQQNVNQDYTFDTITELKTITQEKNSYCLDIDIDSDDLTEKNVLWDNQLIQIRCDSDEDAIMLLLDVLLNFSRKYLPASHGGTMDSPLVVTTKINPQEIDDEVHEMETVFRFPLSFYEAAVQKKSPGEVDVETVADRLGKDEQYENLGFMFDCTSIDEGPIITQYAKITKMADKVNHQLELGKRIRAVDEKDVAERVLSSHFLRDIYGNLRAFGQQIMRCVDCNEKYRRVPLVGKCTKCGGKLLLTINRGGIEKYLKISMDIANNYGLSDYMKQRLSLVKEDIDTIFESEAVRQSSLADFI